MKKRSNIVKYLFTALIVACTFFSINIGYGWWDNLVKAEQESVLIGEWATPITTGAEFKAFATRTNSLSTDKYYLANDINMSSVSWVLDATNNAVVFRGTLYGNNKTISNLTISSNSASYQNIGIFPIMQGGSVFNLKLNNINISLGATALGGSSMRAGLIAGSIIGATNNIKNITITNGGVRATNAAGAGGLVGSVTGATTVLNIQNVKATNLKVFNKASNSGGMVGAINSSGARINVSDIDIQGEVFSADELSNTGGIVGTIIDGGIADIRRVVAEHTSQNTLESTYNNQYSRRHLGGIIGYNQSASANVAISSAFFTGMLYVNSANARTNVGTATGRYDSSAEPTLAQAFYASVGFRAPNGTVVYTPQGGTPVGQMAVLANVADSSAPPTAAWWAAFMPLLNSEGVVWVHNGTTSKPTLIR